MLEQNNLFCSEKPYYLHPKKGLFREQNNLFCSGSLWCLVPKQTFLYTNLMLINANNMRRLVWLLMDVSCPWACMSKFEKGEKERMTVVVR